MFCDTLISLHGINTFILSSLNGVSVLIKSPSHDGVTASHNPKSRTLKSLLFYIYTMVLLQFSFCTENMLTWHLPDWITANWLCKWFIDNFTRRRWWSTTTGGCGGTGCGSSSILSADSCNCSDGVLLSLVTLESPKKRQMTGEEG